MKHYTTSLMIEAGKFYLTRRGVRIGPMQEDQSARYVDGEFYQWKGKQPNGRICHYNYNGLMFRGRQTPLDLITLCKEHDVPNSSEPLTIDIEAVETRYAHQRPLQLKEGSYYRTAKGTVYGPMHWSHQQCNYRASGVSFVAWNDDGTPAKRQLLNAHALVKEVTITDK